MITALNYHIRLARIPLLMNFTGKVVLTSSVIYTKICVCMYGFRIQLLTSTLMSTNRVTAPALDPYIPFIKDYSYVVYSWSRALHLFIRKRSYNIFMTCMVLVGKQQQNKLSVSMIHVCLSVCLFANSFNAKENANFS